MKETDEFVVEPEASSNQHRKYLRPWLETFFRRMEKAKKFLIILTECFKL